MFRKRDGLGMAPLKNGEGLDGNGAAPLLLPAGSLSSTGVRCTWRYVPGHACHLRTPWTPRCLGAARCCCPVSCVHCIPSASCTLGSPSSTSATNHHQHHHQPRRRQRRQRGHIERIGSNWPVTIAHDNTRLIWLNDRARQDALAARLPVGVAVRGRVICC